MTLKSNADELALIAQEIGAEVIRGPVRYQTMENAVILQTCPICLKGPVVQREKSSMLGLLTTKQCMCGQCGSVLHALKGGRYRYTTISSDHPNMEHLLQRVFDSLDDLRRMAELRAQAEARREALTAAQEIESRLQPKTLDEFLGQHRIKEKLAVSIRAAEARRRALGHVLLCGPEGCGKRTLARVVSNEMRAQTMWVSSAKEVEKPYELAEWLSLGERDVVFVDDIHRLRSSAEEFLCGVMHHFLLAEMPLAQFTLIGATDQPKRVSAQLMQRFEHIYEFEPYDDEALGQLVQRRANALGIDFEDEACWVIGRRAKGAIREAERLLDRARDYAQVRGDGVVTTHIAQWAANGTVSTADQPETEPLPLTWQEFESFVARLFSALGYEKVRLTPRAGDQGKDIVMEWADPLRGSRRLYVECKHWQANSVGRRDVQILHSAVMANPAVDEGVLVTTGRFTDGAVDYAKQVGVIQLIDRKKLRELMTKAGILESNE